MYETSHWFRSEDDPSPYDITRDWFGEASIAYSNIFHHNDKTLLRVYFFIVPYILCALFLALGHALTNKESKASKNRSSWYLVMRSILGRTWKFPSFSQRLGMPRHVSTSELMGIVLFLTLNIGTFAVRVKRSLPRGTRKLHFLVDVDEDRGKEPIDPLSWEACEIWAKTLGVLAIMNLGWYLILPIGRRSVVLEAVNLSWEQSVKYHRWVGYYTFLLVVAHCAMYIAVWVHGNGQPRFDPDGFMINHNLVPWGCNACDEAQQRQLRINFFGLAAFALMTIMIVFSLPWIRRHRFELFYYTHHLFIFVLIFLCLHYPGSFVYLIPGVAVYMVDKLYPLFAYRSTGRVSTSMVSSDVLEVSIPTSTQSYYGGAYVFLNCPAVSWLQWHPFSLTSAPSNDHLVLHIKAAGQWTQAVIDSAKENGNLEVRLDGFYGHNAIPSLSQRNAIVLVGGGIGITPMISVANDLLNNVSIPVTLIWVVRTVTEFSILADDLARSMKQHDNFNVRVWITMSQPEPSLNDTEQAMQTVDKENMNHMQDNEIHDRILTVLESMRNNKMKSITYNKSIETSSPLYVFNRPGLQPTTNAIIMAVAIIIALSAYALTWNLGYVNQYTPEEKLIFIQIATIVASIVTFIIILEIARRIYKHKNPGKSLNDSNHSISTNSDTDSSKSNDSETSHESLLLSMIQGRIGCRPDLKSEFQSIPANEGQRDVAVLACGPVNMIQSVNEICNVPSSKCSYGGMRQEDGSIAFFTYTEDDWEW